MRKIKTLRGYTALARFIAECSDEPIGEIAKPANIPSPYRYSPAYAVYRWNDRNVVWFETAHARYEVYEIPSPIGA